MIVESDIQVMGVGYSSGRSSSSDIANISFSDGSPVTTLSLMLQNTFQSLYHLVRLELGVILGNRIYASPQLYNGSIFGIDHDFSYQMTPTANVSRQLTSNATLMAEWAATVRSFNTTDRVPVMPYARTVPRLKPLGSAMTSVFVSTFAMLSVLWTSFNILAAAFAGEFGLIPPLAAFYRSLC
jgi:hypothetical protein